MCRKWWAGMSGSSKLRERIIVLIPTKTTHAELIRIRDGNSGTIWVKLS